MRARPYACCGWKLKKLEVIIFISLFSLLLIFDLIPFITNSYGPYGLWCWIYNIEIDCSSHIAGLWEQVWLLISPFGFVVSTLYHITTLVWNQKLQNCTERGSYCPLVLCQHSFIVWMLVAISTQSTIALIPLIALIGIHLPFSSMLFHAQCKHQWHGESNPQATLHVSSNGT